MDSAAFHEASQADKAKSYDAHDLIIDARVNHATLDVLQPFAQIENTHGNIDSLKVWRVGEMDLAPRCF